MAPVPASRLTRAKPQDFRNGDCIIALSVIRVSRRIAAAKPDAWIIACLFYKRAFTGPGEMRYNGNYGAKREARFRALCDRFR